METVHRDDNRSQDIMKLPMLMTCERVVDTTTTTSACGSLGQLVEELHQIFSDDHVNIEYVHDLMSSYKTNPHEWKKFAKFDRFRYTRNLVDGGNGKFNLMILCWGEGHASAIHDHANAHCFMKMLQGELMEVRYSWPCRTNGDSSMEIELPEDHKGLHELSRTRLRTNSVCYINDSLGLHHVENPSNSEAAVSLHLYCPPFDSCSVFNRKTGQRSQCNVTFWSKFGTKRNPEIQEMREPEDV